MYITSLNLTSFRNYAFLDFRPSDGLNVLAGRNAQGKSTILEAIYLLATSKSHRTSRDIDMVRLGDPFARVTGEIRRSARNDVTLEIDLSKAEKKTVKINTIKYAKIRDLIGHLNAVIFSDSDVEMVRGEPAGRRRFLNLEICQISPQYVYALGRYNRVLEQRNGLLKDIKSARCSALGLDEWERQLAVYGATIIAKRVEFVSLLARIATQIYAALTDGSEKLEVCYKPNVQLADSSSEAAIAEQFAEILAARRDVDIARGTTSVGPHRDDLSIAINSLPAREFGSGGQQRTAAIAMKLAEIELLQGAAGENPLVLLDDIMAELDESRRQRVLDRTSSCQTFITTTDLSQLTADILQTAAVFDVEAGKVKRR